MRPITAHGITMTADNWAAFTGVSAAVIRHRVQRGERPEAVLPNPNSGAFDVEQWPGAADTRWDEDATARELMREHGPFSREELAVLFGCTVDDVQRDELSGLSALREKLHG